MSSVGNYGRKTGGIPMRVLDYRVAAVRELGRSRRTMSSDELALAAGYEPQGRRDPANDPFHRKIMERVVETGFVDCTGFCNIQTRAEHNAYTITDKGLRFYETNLTTPLGRVLDKEKAERDEKDRSRLYLIVKEFMDERLVE